MKNNDMLACSYKHPEQNFNDTLTLSFLHSLLYGAGVDDRSWCGGKDHSSELGIVHLKHSCLTYLWDAFESLGFSFFILKTGIKYLMSQGINIVFYGEVLQIIFNVNGLLNSFLSFWVKMTKDVFYTFFT